MATAARQEPSFTGDRFAGVLVRTGPTCNLGCTFCPMGGGGADPGRAEIRSALDEARRAGAERVFLVGGEPTIRQDLLGLAADVTDRGLKLGLVTNGRMLSYAPLRERVLRLGLDAVVLGLHAATAATHDRMVGVTGAFAQTTAALRALAAAPVALEVRVAVGRANAAGLGPLVGLVRQLARRRDALRVTFAVQAPGPAPGARAGPPLPLDAARRALRRALATAAALDVRAGYDGLPDCLAGDLIRHRAWTPHREHLGPAARDCCLPDRRALPRRFVLPCEECVRRESCVGVTELPWGRPPRAARPVPIRGVRAVVPDVPSDLEREWLAEALAGLAGEAPERCLVVAGADELRAALAAPPRCAVHTLDPDEDRLAPAASPDAARRLRDVTPPPGGYAGVLLVGAMNRFFDAERALRWIHGALRPGGCLVVIDRVPDAVAAADPAEAPQPSRAGLELRRGWGAAQLGEQLRLAALPLAELERRDAGPLWSMRLRREGPP